MGQVAISINGRQFQVACDDGQESHLTKLAQYYDDKVTELVGQVGQIGDNRLMLMASLIVTDELFESRKNSDTNGADNSKVVTALSRISKRLSGLADKVESN